MSARRPSELLPDILKELNTLRGGYRKSMIGADVDQWRVALMNSSPVFLRNLANFRDAAEKSSPEYYVGEEAEEERMENDLAWHELMDWFADPSGDGDEMASDRKLDPALAWVPRLPWILWLVIGLSLGFLLAR